MTAMGDSPLENVLPLESVSGGVHIFTNIFRIWGKKFLLFCFQSARV